MRRFEKGLILRRNRSLMKRREGWKNNLEEYISYTFVLISCTLEKIVCPQFYVPLSVDWPG